MTQTDPVIPLSGAHPPILPYGALSAPVVAGVVSAALGVDHGVGALVGAGVVLGNFWVLSVLAPRLITAIARGETPVWWAAALFAKFVLLVGAFFLLFEVLPAFGLLLGFVPLLTGTLAAGIHQALQDAAEERRNAPAAEES